jgi:hypothetical protein
VPDLAARYLAEAGEAPEPAATPAPVPIAPTVTPDQRRAAGDFLDRVFSRRLELLQEKPPNPERGPGDESDDDAPPATLDGWRESAHGAIRTFTPVQILDQDAVLARILQRPDHASGAVLVLGEPGGGKSTLLETWYARRLLDAAEGAAETLYLRLATLGRGYAPPADIEAVREDLLRAARGRTVAGIKDAPVPDKPSLWLLDGLDEISAETLMASLADLPGRVVVSCRTAVWQGLSAEVAGRVDPAVRFEIRHLEPAEQARYLAGLRGWQRVNAEDLVARLRATVQMREIAGSPLLLDLIAYLGHTVELPASRAELFKQGFQRYWNLRVPAISPVKRSGGRARILQGLAARMVPAAAKAPWDLTVGFDGLEAVIGEAGEAARTADWVDAFAASGILAVNDETGTVGFAHLTFQEYALAGYWLETGPDGKSASERFRGALIDHWEDPKAEEALALLLGMASETDASGVDRVLMEFVEEWLTIHQRTPKVLWDKGRSPLRTVLHIVTRSAIPVDSWRRLFTWVLGRAKPNSDASRQSAELRELFPQALSVDTLSPSAVLQGLADIEELHLPLASNPSTPHAVLERLAEQDRWGEARDVAANPSTPRTFIRRLAEHWHDSVREAVAGNPFAPEAALNSLADDKKLEVRRNVAGNPSAPDTALQRLAKDTEWEVRRSVAENPSTTLVVLKRLSDDAQPVVRRMVAANPSLSKDLLECLSWSDSVGFNIASNPSAETEILERLLHHTDHFVRAGVASNPATPSVLLQRLADDPDTSVRGSVARNRSAPPALLRRLAEDTEIPVRYQLALNPSTPSEVLRHLAQDGVQIVRFSAACNPSTPPEALERLSHELPRHGDELLAHLARNPSTPLAVLERLAEQDRWRNKSDVATNPSTLLESLLLAGDRANED